MAGARSRWTDEEILQLVDLGVDAALRRGARQPKAQLLPGTVESYDPTGIVYVTMDGDPDEVVLAARNMSGRLAPQDRVNVEFVPGGGVLVRGRRTDDRPHQVGGSMPVTALEPPFGANWAAATTLDSLTYRRDASGIVHLSGLIKWTGAIGAAAGTTITTLSDVVRPIPYSDGTVRSRGPWVIASGGGGTGQVVVQSDGDVVYVGGVSPELGVGIEIAYDPGLGI